MTDDDKNLDKNLTRIMIGGAALTSALIIAGAYDVGYQAGVRQVKAPTIVHGDYTVNNSFNLSSDDAGSVTK
jgi:hypothetical protein